MTALKSDDTTKIAAGFHWNDHSSYYDLIRDDMSDCFGEEHLSAQFKAKMRECMAKWEDDEEKVPAAMDAFWLSMVDLFQATDLLDEWVDCDEKPDDEECVKHGGYKEFVQKKGFNRFGKGTDREYMAYEKCNHVSN